jgi:hypothetical protein
MPKIATNDPRWKAASSDVPEKLKVALEALSYMPNAVANWMEGHGGDQALASQNAKKVRQAENLLGEVLASLPAAVEYLVVGLAGQHMKFKTREDLIRGLDKFNITPSGSGGGSHLRPELRGQPSFSGLAGPMYGGPGVVRYETSEVNNSNSM